jgi:hypothetical protein
MAKQKTKTIVTPGATCPVSGCGRFLGWQSSLRPGREQAVCDCGHKIYHNKSVVERQAANTEESLDGNTE